MCIKKSIVVCLLILLYSNYCFAADSAGTLSDYCKKGIEILENASKIPPTSVFMEAGICLGYMRALDDASRLHPLIKSNFAKNKNEVLYFAVYCAPLQMTASQMMHMFVKYVGSHPEIRHQDAAIVLTAIMAKAFPCNKADSTE